MTKNIKVDVETLPYQSKKNLLLIRTLYIPTPFANNLIWLKRHLQLQKSIAFLAFLKVSTEKNGIKTKRSHGKKNA